MVRFSTSLCPSEEPPPAKRLKTSIQQEDQGRDKDLISFSNCSGGPSASNSISTSGFDGEIDSSVSGHRRIVSFDLDVLDCNICMEALSPPVFQCCNGHYACHDCMEKMENKCPSCSESVGKIRNLALDRILESLRIRCKFFDRGCTEGMIPFRSKKIHERKCWFAPCDCPLSDCDYVGSLNTISSHLQSLHNVKTLPFCFDRWFTVRLSLVDGYMLLQERKDYFLLQAHDQCFGKLLFVSFLTPQGLGELYTYQLEVKIGEKYLSLTTGIQSVKHSKLNLNSTDFLLVPQSFLGGEELQVEVSIKHSLEVQ